MRAVLLAAGEGVRLQPLTLTKPKCLLPVGGKPLLEHIFKALKEAGVRETLVVLGSKGLSAKEIYGRGGRFGLNLSYTVDRNPKGTGSSLLLARKFAGRERFLTLYGDLYFPPKTLKKFLEEASRLKASTVLAVARVEGPQDYGMVQMNGKRVLRILEKPSSSRLKFANAGIYLFQPEVFGILNCLSPSPRGEIELTDAVNLLARRGEVYAVEVEGWLDVGRPWDLLEANRRVLEEAEGSIRGIVEPQTLLSGRVILEEDARIRFGSVVEGPAFIGSGCEVGPHARIRPYTSLGRNVKVGSFCEVKNSIIMDGSKLSHLCYVGDSIIGEGCNLGAGTLIANLRLDERPVEVKIKGLKVDSGLRKLGAVIGDGVRTGVNVSIMPGVKVGCGSWIEPGLSINFDVPAKVLVSGRQQIVFRPLGEAG